MKKYISVNIKVINNRVDITPVNKGENMNSFFRQFVDKTVTISVDDMTTPVITHSQVVKPLPTCKNPICTRFGECQGHWTKEDLKDE